MSLLVRVMVVGAVAMCAGGVWVSSGSAASRCQVSTTTPLAARPSFNVGTLRLAVSLPNHATFVAVPEGRPGGAWVMPDGSIRTKVGWLSRKGTPRVSGRRLDRPARPLDADVGMESFVLGSGPFYPSRLVFPTVGCWQISARNSEARLTVVVRVVKR